jgi:hypothetical protein
MRHWIWLIVPISIVLPMQVLMAQDVVAPDTLGVQQPPAAVDSSRVSGGAPAERVIAGHADTLGFASRPTKSTSLAMGLSALLPGAGQFYNESYWKVPIVVGLGIYFISYWLDNNRRYLDYKDQYAASVVSSPPGGDARLLRVREFYKDQRDSFMWYFIVLYFANIADAYVDASLYSFNVGNDLSIRLMPGWAPMAGVTTELQFRITF